MQIARDERKDKVRGCVFFSRRVFMFVYTPEVSRSDNVKTSGLHLPELGVDVHKP